MLDTSIAVAVNQQLDSGEGASTVEIKLNYLRPVKKGTLWAESKIIQKGRQFSPSSMQQRIEEGLNFKQFLNLRLI